MNGPLSIFRYSLTFRRGPGNARSTRRAVDGFLLRCGDGYGCVHPWPELGDPDAETLLHRVHTGQSHRLLERALCCARHDGGARREGRSLFSDAARIPLSHATVPGGEADYPALRAAGFTAVKLKVHGGTPGLADRVRPAVEAGLRVRLDCNETGISELRALGEFGEWIEFIEDPEPYDATRWREIRRELGLPLALDRLAEGAAEDGGEYDVRVLKPALDSTEARAVPVVFTSYMDHPLGQMFAAWEAANYRGEQREAGLLTHGLFEPDAFTAAVRCEGPQLLPPGGTGLGFDALLAALPWVDIQRNGNAATISVSKSTLPEPGLYLNPRAPLEEPPVKVPEGCYVFATSGSTGTPSLICLPWNAMLANAAAVNAWIGAVAKDVWLRVLPVFHVGGMSIHLRAALSGSQVAVDEGKWDAERFVSALAREGATLTSLVPAQVYDLVTAGQRAPADLRVVFVGGGPLETALYHQARALGWPVLPGFGMTETSSQVAIARLDSLFSPLPPDRRPELELLPCWEARVNADDRLELRGEPLLSGRLVREPDGWQFRPGVNADGWFTTADRVRLEGRTLIPLGRSDRVVKVLGELVDLDALEAALLRAGLPPDRGVVVAMPDPRAGMRPWLVTDLDEAGPLLEAANAGLPPFARLAGWHRMELPRSPLGKVLRAQVRVP